ncbi:group-specific protein [Bacillus sp. BGMRC 2118]|nr:group-specific protein [Bacillus sp. BGMRC 2118]
MSTCKIDHSIDDVKNKLEEQVPFLPPEIYTNSLKFLLTSPTQLQLNELFHLLKKYDLADTEQKLEKNQKLKKLIF